MSGVLDFRANRVVVATSTITAVYLAWAALRVGGAAVPIELAWATTLPVGALASWACWRAVPADAYPAARRFWRHMGITTGLLSVGGATNAYAVVVAAHGRETLSATAAGQIVQVPEATLAIYAMALLMLMWALLRLPSRAQLTAEARRRFVLDAAIVMFTTGVFVWYLSFRHFGDWAGMISSRVAPTLGVIALGFIGGFAFLKIALLGARAVDTPAMRLLAVAASVGATTGAAGPWLAQITPSLAATISLAPTALLITLAADRQRRAAGAPQPATEPPRRLFSFVPYLAVAAVDGLLMVTAARRDDDVIISAVAAVLLTAAVVYRQISALSENNRLLNRVDATVRELRDTQAQLAHQAQHDSLTGLANRRLFEQRVAEAGASAVPSSVVLIDLDDFKVINDRLGHVTGDSLLVAVAQRLRACVRSDDTVARFGGDEFALLLPGVSATDAIDVLDRIATALERPVSVSGLDLLVGSSIGVADAAGDLDAIELLRRADLAMYAAKSGGKGRHARYDATLDERAATDAQMGADLRLALDRGEFHLLFQPVVQLPDGVPAGAEALVRWTHPSQGMVPPDVFIAAAERTGLIVPLGSWILREACRQASLWLRRDGASQPWRVGVNISARQLREPGFASQVAEALRESGLTADRLTVEVTETAVFENGPAVEALTAISHLGVSVALDDFGTGHSSLGLLRTTPVDILKVDKSFIDGIPGREEESIIATAMLQIAEGLHLGTVAEGVETRAQVERLHQLGYRLAQGYYFDKPLPATEMGAKLAAAANHSAISAA
ncbi:putative bifunctional diguanylate cyclase/phosphodiesterase [Pilimelia columellifera]|uniref:Bifunctional diguanylate cyclase/phosphodiesterase n=1 Tax=Pilimelia columellifera subsp. columellifera TaxID=706583 RepID=A0ABN3NMX0_9ACTN